MKYKNIIWDWNGTILNDAPVAFEATKPQLFYCIIPKPNNNQAAKLEPSCPAAFS